MTITCSICKLPKGSSEFGHDKRRSSGFRSSCNPCRHEREYVKNADKIKAKLNHKYSTDHKFREAARAKAREKYASDPDEIKARSRRSAYYKHGLTSREFLSRQEQRQRKCDICGRTPEEADSRRRDLCIDHDHTCCDKGDRSCGKCNRGLICGPCNSGLGHFNDSIERMEAAVSYLKSYLPLPK